MANYLPQYTLGTHRLVSPQETLDWIKPFLPAMGITRCADISRLDVDLGVYVYTAIRPQSQVLQTGNGKGLSVEAAKVSALMEAIELYHAEHPDDARLERVSENSPNSSVALNRVQADQRFFQRPHSAIAWVSAQELVNRREVWLPASVAWFMEPTQNQTNTNGLGSGNHLVEASLHGLYELIERDAVSNLMVNGRLEVQDRCQIIDTSTLHEPTLIPVLERIRRAGSTLILLRLPSCIPVYTFWAVLLNERPTHTITSLNVGYGTHLNPAVAAARAITESVQSRLTVIQASREDIIGQPVYHRQAQLFRGEAQDYFRNLEPNLSWVEAQAYSDAPTDLLCVMDWLLDEMAKAGHPHVYRISLSKPEFGIPVVKMIVPTLKFERKLF